MESDILALVLASARLLTVAKDIATHDTSIDNRRWVAIVQALRKSIEACMVLNGDMP